MRKWTRAACCALLCALGLSLPYALKDLPYAGRSPAESGFAGVIRLWAAQDIESGAGWLKACCALYEKKHPGVYVQIRWVSEADMRLAVSGETGAPDAILFPSGMLSGPEGLAEISAAAATLPALPATPYALPVAMSGYLWCAGAASPAMACPEDSGRACYSAALLAACARYEDPDAPARAGDGMNIGLPTPQPTPAQRARSQYRPQALARRNDACALLAAGKCGAILISRPGYAALAALSDAGRAAEYTLSAPGVAFSDLIAWFSVPHGQNPARVEAARALGAFLLEEDCQSRLAQCGAFRAVPGEPLYDAASGMAALEAALSSPGLIAAPAFGSGWRTAAAGLLEDFLSGRMDAWEAVDRLRTRIADP